MTNEQIAMLNDVISITEANIATLESAIVSDLNKGRYVILMGHSIIAACKHLGGTNYNFSAMGADAATFTESQAIAEAAHFEKNVGKRMFPMPVYPFYVQALESARANLETYKAVLP